MSMEELSKKLHSSQYKGIAGTDLLLASFIILLTVSTGVFMLNTIGERTRIAEENQKRFNDAVSIADHLLKEELARTTEDEANLARNAAFHHEIDGEKFAKLDKEKYIDALSLNGLEVAIYPLSSPSPAGEGGTCVTMIVLLDDEMSKMRVCVW